MPKPASRKRRAAWWAILVAVIAGCAADPTPTPQVTESGCPVESVWGEVITLANAGLASPPALAFHPQLTTLAYVTSDANGARQVMRRWIDNRLTDPLTLTLPPTQPRAQLTFPAGENRVFLLWIDLDEASQLPALFSALITPTTEIARGPLRLSAENERVYDYAAVLNPDGTLWVAWTGAATNEANVSLRQIDADGRPGQSITLATNAIHPALITNRDGTLTVFYEQGAGVIRARTADGVLLESARITGQVSRTPGTLIHSLYAGVSDGNIEYLFWNLTRDDGRRETWFSTGASDALNWTPPALFEPPYTWVRPLIADTSGDLSLAVTEGDQIKQAVMRGGAFVNATPITRCTPVIDPPALYTNGQGLVLAWSQPRPAAPAALQVTLSP